MMRCVNEYFECLRNSDLDIRQARTSKARLRTFIAGKNCTEATTGTDTDRDFLSDVFHMTWLPVQFWDHPTFNDAKTFLRQLLAA